MKLKEFIKELTNISKGVDGSVEVKMADYISVVLEHRAIELCLGPMTPLIFIG